MRFFERPGSDDDGYSSNSSAQDDVSSGEEGYDYSEHHSDTEESHWLSREEQAELDALEAFQKAEDFALDAGSLESTLDQLTIDITRSVSDKSVKVDQLGKMVASFFTDPALPFGPTSLDMLEHYQSYRDKKAHEILLTPRALRVFIYAACKDKPQVLRSFNSAIRNLNKQQWLTILSRSSQQLLRFLEKTVKIKHVNVLSSLFAQLKDTNQKGVKKLLLAYPYLVVLDMCRGSSGDAAHLPLFNQALSHITLDDLSTMLRNDSDFLMRCAEVSARYPGAMRAINTVLLSSGRDAFDALVLEHPVLISYAACLASKSDPLLFHHVLPRLSSLSVEETKGYLKTYPKLFKYCTHAAAKGHALPLCAFASTLNQMDLIEQQALFSSVVNDRLAMQGVDRFLAGFGTIAVCQQFLQEHNTENTAAQNPAQTP